MLANRLASALLWVYIALQEKGCFCVQGRAENSVRDTVLVAAP